MKGLIAIAAGLLATVLFFLLLSTSAAQKLRPWIVDPHYQGLPPVSFIETSAPLPSWIITDRDVRPPDVWHPMASRGPLEPPFIPPESDWIPLSFLPEHCGTLGVLNANDEEMRQRWYNFLYGLQEDQEVANLTEAEIQIGAIYIPPQPPAPLGPWVHETQVEIIRQSGRALRTYSNYDRKIINRVLLGMPELPWLRRVMYYSHPFSSEFRLSPVKDPNFYQLYLESFVLR